MRQDNGLVTRLTHDDELAQTVHRGLGNAARPAGCTLEELADRIGVQATPRYMTVSLNGRKTGPSRVAAVSSHWRSGADRTRFLTGTEGKTHFSSGALLVSFRLANLVDDAVG